ncbi:MAG: DUF4065 domain-containing protein [Lachnospiraceae bacterium]|nr:DUF4065 domain-containing protein [Lachnospiraceae bacterium]
MEEHECKIIKVKETNIFKDIMVEYNAEYNYCEKSDETFADESQISKNDISMKNAYRERIGLLKSNQISDIRSKYSISQSDLCILLGWGQKTITRYESHQVQDNAHDTILRKLDSDPEWFIELLNNSKSQLSDASYSKYLHKATILFENDHDIYLRSAILSKYTRYINDPDASGNQQLSIDAVIDMINYLGNSTKVSNLFLVKLMKMLWYADALSYKRYGHAISGLVYRALPMGAVPIAYETIINLNNLSYEEIEFGDGTGYKFLPNNNNNYKSLSKEDKEILESIIQRFGKVSKDEIVQTMHLESAYKNTEPNNIISFKYAHDLSI